jgi:hypothetical protein
MWDTYTIIIHISDTRHIVCEPTHVFSVYKKNKTDKDCIVVLYHIQYQEKTKEWETIHSTHIPYYVSNGVTNRLRANLLFPMLCFSLKIPLDDLPDGMYTGTLPQFGIVKYKLVETMDINKINHHLFSDSNVNRTDGITSVLPRIANMLDLIISCSSTMFFQYNDAFHIFDLFRFVPLDIDSKEHYNISVVIRGEHRILFRNVLAFQLENKQRGQLLKQLYVWNKMLTEGEQPIVMRSLTKLPVMSMSYAEFNQTITNLCKNKEIHQTFASEYRLISEMLHQAFLLDKRDLQESLFLLPQNRIDIEPGSELEYMTRHGTCESLRHRIESLDISFDTLDSIYKEIIRLEFIYDKPVYPKKEIDDIRLVFMSKCREYMDSLSRDALNHMIRMTFDFVLKIRTDMQDFYSPFIGNLIIELKERIDHQERLEKARLEKEHMEEERLKKERMEQQRIEQERFEKEYIEQVHMEHEFDKQQRIEMFQLHQDEFFDKYHRADLRSKKLRMKKKSKRK